MFHAIYNWLDSLWQWVAEKIFVRFHFDIPTEKLLDAHSKQHLVFCVTRGGFYDWLILTSWSRKQGMGAILVTNRLRILLFSKPLYFFQILFRRRSYAELFMSNETGPRLLFVSGSERRQLFAQTPSEVLLSEVHAHSSLLDLNAWHLHSIFILWRKHSRGGTRRPSELLFGLGTNPNFLGKIWYLFRKREDSLVKSLGRVELNESDGYDLLMGSINETVKVARAARRKILVVNQNELRVILGAPYHSPYAVKETILHDAEFAAHIETVAKSEGLDSKKVFMRAYQNLTDIVANFRYSTVEFLNFFLCWLFTRVFDGVDYREDDIKKVRETLKTKSVVYLPCHRSHFDYLVIPYILFNNDMATPYIAAGNNLAFWPLGPLLRSGGAFFIRRSFRGDTVYSLAVRKYIEFLLKNRQVISFFIEGTRSRSGKMLPPALGLLKTVMEAVDRKVVGDVVLQPVSIAYDEVPEESAYARELAGANKSTESTSGLIRSSKVIRRKRGRVYVRFADPIELSANADIKQGDNLTLQKTAFEVSKAISDVTPITPKSILAAVILCHRNLTLDEMEIKRLSRGFLDYALKVGRRATIETPMEFEAAIAIQLRTLVKRGIVGSEQSGEGQKFFCDERKRVALNYYKNTGIHAFVLPSIYWLSIFRAKASGEFPQSVEAHCLRLRNILKFEFFFEPTATFTAEVRAHSQDYFGVPDLTHSTLGALSEALREKIANWDDCGLYGRLVVDLLGAYQVVLDVLKRHEKGSLEVKPLVQEMSRQAQAHVDAGRLRYPESVSTMSFNNALQMLTNFGHGILERVPGNVLYHYPGWEKALNHLEREISGYIEVLEADPATTMNSQ